MTISVFIPLMKIPSNNTLIRGHWAKKHRLLTSHKWLSYAKLVGETNDKVPALPVTVTIIRIGGRRMDDDNYAGGCKGCRDGIAKFLGIDDGDRRITWRYEQEPRGRGEPMGVRITVEGT